MYTSCYNPIRRADTKRPVLHPINITIAGSTPENAGLHIEVLNYKLKCFYFYILFVSRYLLLK